MKGKQNNFKIFKNICAVLIFFIIAEITRTILFSSYELRIIDLRLIFILIVSSHLGVKYGLLASLLASSSYIISYYNQTLQFDTMLLNTNNWIAIAMYIIFSIIIGLKADNDYYKTEDYKKEIAKLKKEEKKYIKRNEKLKNEIMEINKTLITNRNSYVNVAKFIKRLETSSEDKDALDTLLKEALENNNVEFMSFKDISKKLKTSFTNDEIKGIKTENIWTNKKFKKDIPLFIAPVFGENKEMVIVVWECTLEQMTVEYRNKIIAIAEIIKKYFGKKKRGVKKNVI